MPEYLAPGVYVEEVSSGVQPIQGVATSITAFVGMTERGPIGTPTVITSVSEYERVFGGHGKPLYRIESVTGTTASPTADLLAPQAMFGVGADTYALHLETPGFLLHSAIRQYFANGGSRCVIVSAGSDPGGITAQHLIDAIEALDGERESSLLVVPETVRLPHAEAATVHRAMLANCAETEQRFAILDMSSGYLERAHPGIDPVDAFRSTIGQDNLEHGAAYYPWLRTSVAAPLHFTFENIDPRSRPLLEELLTREDHGTASRSLSAPTLTGDFTIVAKPGETVRLTAEDFQAVDDSRARDLRFSILDDGRMTGRIIGKNSGRTRSGFRQKGLLNGKLQFVRDKDARDPGQFDLIVTDENGNESTQRTVYVVSDRSSSALKDIARKISDQEDRDADAVQRLDRDLRSSGRLYLHIMAALQDAASVIPPGPAMAGVYARNDASRGVWKAPAGVSILGTSTLPVAITDRDQADLQGSLDGVSVNPIRAFPSRGILVWGARTLAGPGSEWRYVPVRRTALMISRSIQEGLQWAVFEPNDANTWMSIKRTVENFLMILWSSGALAGSTSRDAFFVKVGLGSTMTADDISNGRLITEIGFAPVRPAEFVVLRIQHRTQTP